LYATTAKFAILIPNSMMKPKIYQKITT